MTPRGDAARSGPAKAEPSRSEPVVRSAPMGRRAANPDAVTAAVRIPSVQDEVIPATVVRPARLPEAPTTTPRRPRQAPVVEERPRFFSSDLDGAPRWWGGLLAGLQGAILSLLLATLPAVAAFVATSAEPANAGVPWTTAAAVGVRVWLLGHGVPLSTPEATVTLIPLGVMIVSIVALSSAARRSASVASSALVAGIGAYVAVVVVAAAVTGLGPLPVVRAAAGGALVAGVGIGAGLAWGSRAVALADVRLGLLGRLPRAVRCGARIGTAVVAAATALAAIAVAVVLLQSSHAVLDVVDGLDLDPVAATLLTMAQLGWLPDASVWALSYLVGPGFAVGAGSSVSTGAVTLGSMPAIPVLAALPHEAASGPVRLAPLMVVVIAALLTAWSLRRLSGRAWWEGLVVVATMVLTSVVLVLGLAMAASGAIGAGSMSTVGPDAGALVVAWAPLVLVGSGAALLGDSALRRAVGSGLRALMTTISTAVLRRIRRVPANG